MAIADIQELLSDDYVRGLDQIPMAELRRRRERLDEAADELSYLRRLVQGRLDLVHADLERRRGGEASDIHALVEQLQRGEIMADKGTSSSGLGRLPRTFGPADDDGWIMAELDQLAGATRLASLPDLSDDEVRATADGLIALERKVSHQRAALHDRTNKMQEEVVRRYKTGEASVESLLK